MKLYVETECEVWAQIPLHFTGTPVFRPLGMNVSENVFVILSNSTCNEN